VINKTVNLYIKTFVFLLVAIIAQTVIADPVQNQDITHQTQLDQQIQLIDAEIWLLKAELAQKNGDIDEVKSHLQHLDSLYPNQTFPSQFVHRVEKIKRYLSLTAETRLPQDFTGYQFNPNRMLALLPMSGDYAEAGQTIYQAMMSELSAISPSFSLEVLDTNIYDSMLDVWDWVRLYQPSFIFGPLQKEHVLQLASLPIETPMLVFNETKLSNPYVKFLTPHSSQSLVNKLVDLMGSGVYRRVVVFTDDSRRSQTMLKQLKQTWKLNHDLDDEEIARVFTDRQVNSHVDKALESVVHGQKFEVRMGWLQKVIQTPIHSVARARKDVDLIVSFLPYRLAMQVTPLLAFYRLNQISHYWIPSKLPTTDALTRSLPFWQGTTAILPSYYTEQLKRKSDKAESLSDLVGIFHALGTSAIKAVTRLSFDEPNWVQTELGILSLDAFGRLHLSPDLVWIDMGSLEKLEN